MDCCTTNHADSSIITAQQDSMGSILALQQPLKKVWSDECPMPEPHRHSCEESPQIDEPSSIQVVSSTPELRGRACRLRVERKPPFLIKYADDNWIHSMGFSNRGEVTGRALRICYGPQTSKADLSIVIRNCGAGLDKVTLYAKDGEGKRMRLRAFAVSGLDGTRECLLEMYAADAPAAAQTECVSLGNEYPKLILASSPEHKIQQANVAFLSFFQCSLPHLTEQGVNLMFSDATDLKVWRKLLRAGSSGRSKACQLSVRSACGADMPTVAQVSPIFSKTHFTKVKKVASLALTLIEESSLTQGLRRVDGVLSGDSASMASHSSLYSDGEDDSDSDCSCSSAAESDFEVVDDERAPAAEEERHRAEASVDADSADLCGMKAQKSLDSNPQIGFLNRIWNEQFELDVPPLM